MSDVFTLIGISPFGSGKNGVQQLENVTEEFKKNFSIEEQKLIIRIEEEFHRKGNFKRIFPLRENIGNYEKLFISKRRNLSLWKWLLNPIEITTIKHNTSL